MSTAENGTVCHVCGFPYEQCTCRTGGGTILVPEGTIPETPVKLKEIPIILNLNYIPEKNRVVIETNVGTLEIDPVKIREVLPYKDEDEQVKELQMMIHELDREKLLQVSFLREKEEGLITAIESTIKKIETCDKKDLYRYRIIMSSYNTVKSQIAQLRLLLDGIEKSKNELYIRIARLEKNRGKGF